MAGIDMSRLALALLGLSLLVLVVGQQADNSHFLTFNDPPITTQQASASPLPINTPPIPASPQAPAAPLPINTPPIPASPQAPSAPLPLNTPPAIPSPIPIDTPIAYPSPIPIDTPIAFPAPIPIDIPIPTLPIPGIGLPKNRHCASMCSRSCSLQRRNRFAYIKCLGLCNLKCIRGVSDVVFDCTKNCAESKSPNFNTDVGNVINFVSSCYEDCKKN